MPESGECLRQKHQTMANEQSQNGRGEYQIEEITYEKEVTLNEHVCVQEGGGLKNRSWDRYLLNRWPQRNVVKYFCALVRPSTRERHCYQGKCRCFLPL